MTQSPTTLIHLVSDQTLQNILPILALKPRHVIQVLSDASNERFVQASQNTQNAVRAAQEVPDLRHSTIEFTNVDLGAPAPDIQTTRAAIAGLLNSHPDAAVNYTGGTKNMSIGAWLAAQEARRGSIYCDSPGRFVDGGTGPPLSPIPLNNIAQHLTVPIIMEAQGWHYKEAWSHGGFSPAEEALGQIGFDLTRTQGHNFRKYRLSLESHGSSERGLQRALFEPVQDPPAGFESFPNQAARCGLLRKKGEQFYYRIGFNLVPSDQLRRIEEIQEGLSGRSFEAFVATQLGKSKKFTSFVSNVQALRGQPEMGETDFVAFAPAKLSLTLISCKSSPAVKLEHLESLLHRKSRFGGLFAGSMICVAHAGGSKADNIKRWCRSLKIECAIGEQIPKALGVLSPGDPALS